jgi:hypothetical protein
MNGLRCEVCARRECYKPERCANELRIRYRKAHPRPTLPEPETGVRVDRSLPWWALWKP